MTIKQAEHQYGDLSVNDLLLEGKCPGCNAEGLVLESGKLTSIIKCKCGFILEDTPQEVGRYV